MAKAEIAAELSQSRSRLISEMSPKSSPVFGWKDRTQGRIQDFFKWGGGGGVANIKQQYAIISVIKKW